MGMADYLHFVAFTQNGTAGGAANQALIDFDFGMSSPLSVQEIAARIVAYVGGYFASIGAGGSSIAAMSYRLASVPGSILLDFPQDEYDALRATFPGLPTYEGWGEAIGDGALTPIGTSIQVREFSTVPTRSGKGRHYLPFVGSDFINSNGQFSSSSASEIAATFGAFFLGQTYSGETLSVTTAGVYSAKDDVIRPINHVTVSTTCSNLRTRRR